MATAIPSLPPAIPVATTEPTSNTTAGSGQPSFERVLEQQRAPSGPATSTATRPASSAESKPRNSNPAEHSPGGGAAPAATPSTSPQTQGGKATAEKAATATPDGQADAEANSPPALAVDGEDAEAEPTLEPAPIDLVELSLAALAQSAVAGPVNVADAAPPGSTQAAHADAAAVASAATPADPDAPAVARSKAKSTPRATALGGKVAFGTSDKATSTGGPSVTATTATPKVPAAPPVVDSAAIPVANAEAIPAAVVVSGGAEIPASGASPAVTAPAEGVAQAAPVVADGVQILATSTSGTAAVVDRAAQAATPADQRPVEAARDATAADATPKPNATRSSRAPANEPAGVSATTETTLSAGPAAVADATQPGAPALVTAPAVESPSAAIVQTLAEAVTPLGLETVDPTAGATTSAGPSLVASASAPHVTHSTTRDAIAVPPTGTNLATHSVAAIAVDRVRLVQRVARAFQVASQREAPLRLRLSPPELGSVRIEIRLQNGIMQAHLEAETPAAQAALLDGLPALRERLSEQKIRLDRFDVDLLQERSANGSPRQSSGGPYDRNDRALPPAAGPSARRRAAQADATRGPRRGGLDPPGQLNVVV